jgi:cation transport ATPase
MARILVLLVLIISSCTIQKRHFTKGYAIEWKKDYASNSNDYSEAASEDPEPCDTIQNKDGSIVLSAVQRIDSKKIYLTPCENSSFKENSIDRADVRTIHYANGAVFENKTPEQLQKERQQHLEEYRSNQKKIVPEDIIPTPQKPQSSKESATQIVKEKENHKPSNDSSNRNNIFLSVFILIAFSLLLITLLMGANTYFGFFGCLFMLLFLFGLVATFITISTNAIIKRQNHGRTKFKLLLIEILFCLIAFWDIMLWIGELSLFKKNKQCLNYYSSYY